MLLGNHTCSNDNATIQNVFLGCQHKVFNKCFHFIMAWDFPSGPKLSYPLSFSLHSSVSHSLTLHCCYNQYSEDLTESRSQRNQRCGEEKMWEKRILSSRLLPQCEPSTELFPPCAGGRDGNCRREAKTSLYHSLIWEEQRPRIHLFSFLIPTYMSQGKGKSSNWIYVLESSHFYLGIWEILSLQHSFQTIPFLFGGEQRLYTIFL